MEEKSDKNSNTTVQQVCKGIDFSDAFAIGRSASVPQTEGTETFLSNTDFAVSRFSHILNLGERTPLYGVFDATGDTVLIGDFSYLSDGSEGSK